MKTLPDRCQFSFVNNPSIHKHGKHGNCTTTTTPATSVRVPDWKSPGLSATKCLLQHFPSTMLVGFSFFDHIHVLYSSPFSATLHSTNVCTVAWRWHLFHTLFRWLTPDRPANRSVRPIHSFSLLLERVSYSFCYIVCFLVVR